MAQFGSDRLTSAQSTNGVTDIAGVPLIATNNDFDASPLGIAARSQAIYGIANAQFNLLPPDTSAEIADQQNPLPYWGVENYSDGRIVTKSAFDLTAGTWSVEINPTAGSAADYVKLKTRSYLLTDDNLALRQKAYLTMGKGTAYAGSTQFNVTLNAEYFDVNGTSLSSYAVGTALDNGALTSITGITTSGSAAISASAAYVDFTIQLNVTATVTSGVKVYLKSFFIQTSQAATGSFLITETFNSSGTWTRPTGVDYVDVVVLGAGGGGASGVCATQRNSTAQREAQGQAGGGGQWAILRGIYVGDVSTVSVGVGAGGAGGIGTAINKAAASSAQGTAVAVSGAAGGATTFGSYISVPGGGAGTAQTNPADGSGPGTAGGTPTAAVHGVVNLAAGSANGSQLAGGTAAISAFSFGAAYTTLKTGGTAQNGVAGSASGGGTRGTATAGIGSLSAGLSGGGGGSGRVTTSTTGPTVTVSYNGQNSGPGGAGGGGGAVGIVGTVGGTQVATGGRGGDALANSGSGGGGGGCAVILITNTANYDAATLTVTPGRGGNGAAGFVTVVYTA